jgi:hypothetical protein
MQHSYDNLSREAKLNVDADKLATDHREIPQKSKPMHKIDHITSQQVSLSINGRRFPGQWDTNLRWYINGSYMKHYLQCKHQWTDRTWEKIDFVTVESQFRHLSASEKTQRFKFVHDLQPLGYREAKMSPHTGYDLDKCPCCHIAPETQFHLLHCSKNPEYTAARLGILTGGSNYKEAHEFVTVATDCLMQWMDEPTKTPNISTPSSPTITSYSKLLKPHMLQILETALADQKEIGWMNFIRGYTAKAWRTLASTHMEHESIETLAEGHRRMGSITQKLHELITLTWKGRNETLHKDNTNQKVLVRTLEDAEISEYFGHPDLILEHDRHYCTGSLSNVLKSKPSNRRRWLMRVRRSRAAMLQDHQRQQHITSFFPSRTETPQQHHDENTKSRFTTRSTISAPTNQGTRLKQQAKLTHFFPGRPPDTRDPGISSPQSLA